jgi:hypothetical protein
MRRAGGRDTGQDAAGLGLGRGHRARDSGCKPRILRLTGGGRDRPIQGKRVPGKHPISCSGSPIRPGTVRSTTVSSLSFFCPFLASDSRSSTARPDTS